MKNLIIDNEKPLSFPYEEFYKYFKNYPAGVLKRVIIDNALACYCYFLTCSLLSKQKNTYIYSSKISITYSFSEFEINHLKLLNNTNRIKLLKANFKNIKLNNSLVKGFIDFKITPLLKEKIENSTLLIEIELKFKRLRIPKLKTGLRNFFNCLYKTLSMLLSVEIQNSFSIKPQFTLGNKNLDKIYFPILNLPENSFDKDILICIFSLWMMNTSSDFMLFCTDDILELRGVQKLTQNGKRSGYKNIIRDEIKNKILDLNKKVQFDNFIWADDDDKKRASNLTWAGEVSLFDINSWVFEDNYYFIAKPSEFMQNLIDKKSYFLINPAILNYSSKYRMKDKEAAYFLFQKLNKKDSAEIKVKDLIKVLYNQEIFAKPTEIRDRVEDILDRLSRDSIIKWHYKRIDESIFTKKDWVSKWMRLIIIVRKP